MARVPVNRFLEVMIYLTSCIARRTGRIWKVFFGGSVLQGSANIQSRYYVAIFVLASATLSYQILITRDRKSVV